MSSEDSTKEKKQKMWRSVALGVAMAGVAALVILGLSQLFQSNETRTSSGSQTVEAEAMVCETTTPKDPFFSVGGTEAKHRIKVMYRNGEANTIMYEFEAQTGSAEAATEVEARTHADYNIYMGQHMSDFSTNFMPMEDGTYKIAITAAMDRLEATTARIFFINKEDFETVQGRRIEDIKKVIQTAGFHCEMTEK